MLVTLTSSIFLEPNDNHSILVENDVLNVLQLPSGND